MNRSTYQYLCHEIRWFNHCQHEYWNAKYRGDKKGEWLWRKCSIMTRTHSLRHYMKHYPAIYIQAVEAST